MFNFLKKDNGEKSSEQGVFEILENKNLVEKLTSNTELNHLTSGVLWHQFGDFKSYRARINPGHHQEIIFELGWGRESRASLPRLYLNISTPLADFQIAGPSFIGLPVKRRYRHDYDKQLAESLKNLERAIQQQILKRTEAVFTVEGRKRVREFCLDYLKVTVV